MSICGFDDKKRYAPSITESVYSSKSQLLQRRKLTMMPGGMIKNKTNVSDIILSAREKKLKHTRSQLTDANFKLTELCKENDILKCIQKRHEEALQRYESVNGDIPKLMTAQSEEIRRWQTKFKDLKKLCREASQNFNKKNSQHTKLTEEYEYLVKINKTENLGELSDLREQIKELTLKVGKQQETIDCLQRRLVLDEKAHKHQLNLERERRRDELAQKPDETANQVKNSSSTEEEKQNKKQLHLPNLQSRISRFKLLVSESGSLPSPPSHIVRGTMIPRLQIPIPETDKESSEESADERSFRTKTLSGRSYDSDFNDYTSEE